MKPKQPAKYKKLMSGFTIVELMVGVLIAAILMLGVVEIFSANTHASKIGTSVARIQENIRFALKDLSAAGRIAGYRGCSDKINNHLDTSDPDYDEELLDLNNATGGWEFTDGLTPSPTKPDGSFTLTSFTPVADTTKWEDTSGDGLPASLAGKVIAGSDIIVFKWASQDTGVDVQNMNVNSAAIVTGSNTIQQGTILLVTDCSGGDAFQSFPAQSGNALTKAAGGSGWSPGNDNGTKWSHQYTKGADFLFFTSRAYYVGQGVSGEPALYRITYDQGTASGGFVAEEVVEGIETMQVLYGEDTDGDGYADRFVSVQDLGSQEDVVALKIGFLARGATEVKRNASSETFNILGTNITTPSDKRLRYAFSTTIKLRNKGVK